MNYAKKGDIDWVAILGMLMASMTPMVIIALATVRYFGMPVGAVLIGYAIGIPVSATAFAHPKIDAIYTRAMSDPWTEQHLNAGLIGFLALTWFAWAMWAVVAIVLGVGWVIVVTLARGVGKLRQFLTAR